MTIATEVGEVSTDDVALRRLLTEVGMLASILNDVGAAQAIATGLESMRADGIEAVIVRALAEMTDGKHDQAAETLRASAQAGDQAAGAFRALALRLAGRGHESMRQAAMLNSDAGELVALAAALS
ncbi:MAG: hypothetical protein QG656_1018 [Candidatus Hydrogenedentes bacterium]|nr:hypothetical protein [Candidatus Hydrogenedentota bacterium]